MRRPELESREMQFTTETEQEEDGRWIAEVVEFPGVMKYGRTRGDAIAQTEPLGRRVIAERIEAGEHPVEPIRILFGAV
jgi:predicted RNase H-like HicB family nuclease